MRGEYCRGRSNEARLDGSPPHAWGIRTLFAGTSFIPRFTPTCVGNTRRTISLRPRFAVHPHMRGEYACSSLSSFILFGSPPHAWGIRDSALPDAGGNRFTPTCVGNTLQQLMFWFISTVHPHMRGEYAIATDGEKQHIGSPPHAWGIRIKQNLDEAQK